MPLGLMMMNNTRENSLARVCSCAWCACVVEDDLNQLEISCLLLWWLVIFIEALVLFPNIEREGIPQWPNLKGDNKYKLS